MKEKAPEAEAIKIVLNSYELIAIGIQAGAIDLDMYRQMYRSAVINYWKHAFPYVTALRARLTNDNIYIEFQMLAEQFEGKKPNKRNWWKGRFSRALSRLMPLPISTEIHTRLVGHC